MSDALTSTFSGADVVVIFGDKYVGECMSFTIGTNREAGPLYVMGRKEPIAIPKGKRGIGGSFILAQLGYDALLEHYGDLMGSVSAQGKQIWVRKDEMTPGTAGVGDQAGNATAADAVQSFNIGANTAARGSIKTDLWQDIGIPNYVDQIPPFNVTVVGANEQGKKMGFRVYGCTIINDGMAISIEELNMEKKYTFIAQAVSRMKLLD